MEMRENMEKFFHSFQNVTHFKTSKSKVGIVESLFRYFKALGKHFHGIPEMVAKTKGGNNYVLMSDDKVSFNACHKT